MEQQEEVLEEFFEIARVISSTFDLDTLAKRIGWAVTQITNSEASSIMLVDDDKKNLYFKTAIGESGTAVKKIKIRIGQGIAGWVAQERKPALVNDVSIDSRFTGIVDQSTGFQTKSVLCVPMVVGNELVGVVEVLNKKNRETFTLRDQNIMVGLVSFAAVAISNAKLAEDQRNFFVNIIEILANASESRDPKLVGHSWRLTQRALAIARAMGMEQKEYQDLYYASLLHDIGYLSIGDKVLRARNHPQIGAEMLRGINFLAGVVPMIRHHHENYNGTGVPDGLKGDEIPMGARILAILEFIEEKSFDGFPNDQIQQEIANDKGILFDPQVVKAFLEEISLD